MGNGGRTIPGKNFLGRNWCVYDACGIICGMFTWFLLLYGQFCVLSVMMFSVSENIIHQLLNFALFEVFFLLAFVAHLKTMFTDPGSVPKGTLTDEYLAHLERDQQNYGTVLYKCTKCACVRPEKAHHCSVCQRCIKRMDHHCPWVNNCVGENNQKSFVLFTFYVSLLSCQTLYWTIRQFVWCVGNDWHFCSYFSPPVTTILLVFLLFEAILFAIFTAVMFGSQLSAICSDETGIESLKHDNRFKVSDCEAGGVDKPPRRESWKNLQVVFGGGAPFSLNWLNPFSVPFLSEKAFEFSV